MSAPGSWAALASRAPLPSAKSGALAPRGNSTGRATPATRVAKDGKGEKGATRDDARGEGAGLKRRPTAATDSNSASTGAQKAGVEAGAQEKTAGKGGKGAGATPPTHTHHHTTPHHTTHTIPPFTYPQVLRRQQLPKEAMQSLLAAVAPLPFQALPPRSPDRRRRPCRKTSSLYRPKLSLLSPLRRKECGAAGRPSAL